MVFVVEKWEDIERALYYARYILFRVIPLGDDRVELRVKVGRMGFRGEFRVDDPEYKKIIEKLEAYGAAKVEQTVPDEVFMS